MPERNGPHAPSQSSSSLSLALSLSVQPSLHDGGLSISRPLDSINLSSSDQRGRIRKSVSPLPLQSMKHRYDTSVLSSGSRVINRDIGGHRLSRRRRNIAGIEEDRQKAARALCIRHKGGPRPGNESVARVDLPPLSPFREAKADPRVETGDGTDTRNREINFFAGRRALFRISC